MTSTWELKEHSEGILTCTIDGKQWKDAQEKAFVKASKNVDIKGFRKGQAPRYMVEKVINKQSVLYNALDDVLQSVYSDCLKEHDLHPQNQASVDVTSIDSESAVVTFKVVVEPEVTLGEYKGLKYDDSFEAVSDEDINKELEQYQTRYADEQEKEGTVENGDIAVIDYKGEKDGVAFDGGTSTNYPLTIGSNSFIPGFEEQLVGMSKGEEKVIDVTFPKEYHEESLAGQPVKFTVKVNDIKHKVLPAIDDDLAKDVLGDDDATLETLKEKVKTNLETSRKSQAENDAMQKLIDQVVDNMTVEIPEVMVENQTNNMLQDYAYRMQQQGISLSKFLEITKQSVDTLKQEFAKDAEKQVKIQLALKAIAKQENLNPTDEDVEKEYADLASTYQMEVDQVKKVINKDDLVSDLRLQKASDFLKENASK